jgi:hypothetical protein
VQLDETATAVQEMVVLTLWLNGVESWKKRRSAKFSKQINKDQTRRDYGIPVTTALRFVLVRPLGILCLPSDGSEVVTA